MNRPAWTLGVGIGVFILWYFVVLEVVWRRDGISIALGISLALNTALLTWLATAPRSIESVSKDHTEAIH